MKGKVKKTFTSRAQLGFVLFFQQKLFYVQSLPQGSFHGTNIYLTIRLLSFLFLCRMHVNIIWIDDTSLILENSNWFLLPSKQNFNYNWACIVWFQGVFWFRQGCNSRRFCVKMTNKKLSWNTNIRFRNERVLV